MSLRISFTRACVEFYEALAEVPWNKVFKYLILPMMLLGFVQGFTRAIVEDGNNNVGSVVVTASVVVEILAPILLAAGLVDKFRRAMSEPSDIYRSFGYATIFTAKVILIQTLYYLIGLIQATYGYRATSDWTMWPIFWQALIVFAVTAVVIHYVKQTASNIAMMRAAVSSSG